MNPPYPGQHFGAMALGEQLLGDGSRRHPADRFAG